VGQNSTIIHSAYNNSNVQQLKMYQKPKAGGWMESGASNANSGQKSGGVNSTNITNNAATKISKSQITKAVIKPGTSAATQGDHTRSGIRGQLFMSDSNNDANTSQPGPMSSDNTQV